MGRLADQVAIVTGGSRGIGRAISLALADEGAQVVVNYLHHREEAEALVAEINALGRDAIALAADVAEETAVAALVRQTVNTFGRVTILIANAGIVRVQLLAAMTLEQWEDVMRTNLRGTFLCIRAVLPYMMAQKSGNIITMSSIVTEHADRGNANYAASKGGINALTRALAAELAPKGIRVNGVAPGAISTDMTKRVRGLVGDDILAQIPLRRFGDPQDVARAVCFLASNEASYITGEILHVTGGLGL